MGKKTKIAVAGLTALSAGSCAPQDKGPQKPRGIISPEMRQMEKEGLVKLSEQGSNPVEQPNSGVQPSSKPSDKSKNRGLFYEEEEQSSWQYSITPFYARKMALSAKEDKPEGMNMLGFELRAQKDRFSVYAGAERGQSSESEDGSVNGLDYKGKLDITHTTLRTGIGYDVLQGKRGRLTAKLGMAYTMEDADGYLKIATPYGSERMDINDENNYASLEGELQGSVSLTKNIDVTLGVRGRQNFDSDNVEREVLIVPGVTINF